LQIGFREFVPEITGASAGAGHQGRERSGRRRLNNPSHVVASSFRITTAINAAMSPYPMAVTPASSLENRSTMALMIMIH
jgi:hypothetical protein